MYNVINIDLEKSVYEWGLIDSEIICRKITVCALYRQLLSGSWSTAKNSLTIGGSDWVSEKGYNLFIMENLTVVLYNHDLDKLSKLKLLRSYRQKQEIIIIY